MALLEDLQQEQNKEQKEQTKVLIEKLGKIANDGSLAAKDRAKAVRQRDVLQKGGRSLGGDLKKNYQDLKEGLSTTVDGLINETFGPIGGMVTSLTTGFFKRRKENKENLTQNEIQVDQSKDLLESFGVQNEKLDIIAENTGEEKDDAEEKGGEVAEQTTEELDEISESGGQVSQKLDITNEYLRVIADGVPTQEELEEASRKKAAAAGGEVAGPKEEETEGFGMMLIKFLVLVGAAIAGLAVGAAVGVVGYLTGWVKLIGKGVLKLIDAIPRPKFIDDIIDLFKADGTIGKLFTKVKTFFTAEGSIFKKVGKLVDGAADWVKTAFGESNLFTKVKAFFTGETSIFKKVGKLVDGAADWIKTAFGESNIFKRVKTFFTGDTSIFKKVGTLVDGAVDWVKTAFGESNIFKRVKTFFTSETSIFKKVGKLVDGAADWVKTAFGESNIFSKVKSFFTGETSIFKKVGGIVDTTVTALKGFGGKMFTSIGDVFTTLKSVGTTLASPFKTITDIFGGTKKASGFMKLFEPFLDSVKFVFRGMAGIAAKLVAPLNIIMGIFDAGFETADAVSKSEGFFATFLNGLIGAVAGFFDGAILQLLDFIKSGVSLLAGFLGFSEIEKYLDSFSLSESFNKWLDSVYKGVNEFFKFDFTLPSFKDFLPTWLGGEGKDISTLFGEEAAAAAEATKPDEKKTKPAAAGAPVHGFTGSPPLNAQKISLKGLNPIKYKIEKDAFGGSIKVPIEGEMAEGGVIVNRPTYLPSSGVVVGEAKSWSGTGGAAVGGIPKGRPEAIIPLGGPQAQSFIEPVAQAIAGQSLNQMQLDRIGMDTAGASAAPTIVDSSTTTQVFNETNIRNPSVDSPHVFGESTDKLIRMVG